jgi:hypothetical protein
MATSAASIPDDTKVDSVNQISQATIIEHDEQRPPIVNANSYLDDEHVNLGWRSWMVVFVTCFASVLAPTASALWVLTSLEQ